MRGNLNGENTLINLNENSLGIELVNKGHQFGYQNFSNKQIKSLIIFVKI